MTKRQMLGGKFTPPTNPPDITYMPWHPVTLVISHSKTLDFQVKHFKDYLKAQLDPTNRGFNQTSSGDKRFVIQVRLLQISAWNLTGRVIALSVDDYTDSLADSGARDQLCGLVDTGSSLHIPCVGYTLSQAHQQHVLRTDDKQDNMYLFQVSGSTGEQFITYVKILYRFDGPAKHPTILSPLQEIRDTVSDLSNEIAKREEPSTLELTVNGVRYLAEAVTILSGDAPAVSRLPQSSTNLDSAMRRLSIDNCGASSHSELSDASLIRPSELDDCP